jgi:hypothetical protein
MEGPCILPHTLPYAFHPIGCYCATFFIMDCQVQVRYVSQVWELFLKIIDSEEGGQRYH